MADAVLLAERKGGIGAVDRTRRGVDQVLDARLPRTFEDVEEADEIAARIGVRIGDRIAHARLGSKVDDAARPVAGEDILERRPVRILCP